MPDTPPDGAPARLVLVPAAAPPGHAPPGHAPPGHATPGYAALADAAPHPDAPAQVVVLRGDADHVVIEAASRLTLRVGASSLTLDADGTILLHGVRVAVAADEALTTYSAGEHTIRGASVDIN